MPSEPETSSENSIKSVWANATNQIEQQIEDDTAETDARILLQHCLQQPHSYLLTWPERELSKKESYCFNKLLKQRLNGEPIAYIIGHREFWSMDLKVTPDTLIPRPETELLVELALQRITACNLEILDMGTGSGAIALAIAAEKPDCKITASDLSEKALLVAKENANNFNLENICFIQSDWGDDIPDQKFDLIVSNPPYIDKNDPHLQQGDLRFEPEIALAASGNGLADLQSVIEFAHKSLSSGGWLLLEHGYNQNQRIKKSLLKADFKEVQSWQDIFGNSRVSGGKL